MTGGHLAPADERVGNRKPLIYTTAPPLDSTILWLGWERQSTTRIYSQVLHA